jgi:hypothetical protein
MPKADFVLSGSGSARARIPENPALDFEKLPNGILI